MTKHIDTMKITSYPPPEKWAKWGARPAVQQRQLMRTVRKTFRDIRRDGDRAVLAYSRKFDCPEQERLTVTASDLEQAAESIPETLKQAIALARTNIETFHRSQREEVRKTETAPGVVCWRESRPIERVGIYVPGGSAPLFSTLLMLAIPATLAGCREIILCTPPDRQGAIHPAIRYAAQLTGITKIFAVGGIQAIAAMTFGTESIPKTDKIFGPGNQYVTAAKQEAQYYGTAIDMPAGPSELLIIADESCHPPFVAADLLSQAEHGPDSQVLLLSNNRKVLTEVNRELDRQLPLLPRREIADQVLQHSRAFLFDRINDCIAFSNHYAPEHLIIATQEPAALAEKVINAGSVFLGNYSCESAGDYASGTNHTLPTNGYAKAYSGVSLDSFVKKITFQQLNAEGIRNIGAAVATMAEAEQLHAHRNAVVLRMKGNSEK